MLLKSIDEHLWEKTLTVGDNQDLIKSFNIEVNSLITPNDFYVKFRSLFLDYFNNNSSDIFETINKVQDILLQQNCYDEYLFFLKYFKIFFEEKEIIFFDKELFENSNTLEEFLDNLAQKIYVELSVILNFKNKNWLNWLTFTSENILVSECVNEVEGLFWLNEDEWEKLLYWLIRYLIIERWINFPKIKEVNSYKWLLFDEFNKNRFDVIIEGILSSISWNNDEENEPAKQIMNYKWAKDFVIFCINNFGDVDWCEDKRMWEFTVSNHLSMYLNEYINSFTFEDFKEILLESIKWEGSLFYYMLNTESWFLWQLLLWVKDLSREEIKRLEPNDIKLIYIRWYILNQISQWKTFYLDIKNNKFFILTKTFEQIIRETSILLTKNKIKAFLWSETNILSDMVLLLGSNLLESFSDSEISCVNLWSSDDVKNKLIDLVYKEYLKIDKNEVEIKALEAKDLLSNDTIKITVDNIRIHTERLLENWTCIYNSLLLWYDEKFLPIWWKIHFKDWLSAKKVDKLKKAYLFDSSPFTLQHSNESMLLPPCESPFQLIAILKKLHDIWVINDGDLELQLWVAWRLPNELSWVLWSSMIFMKNYQITYPKEAFCTWSWDNLTKSCIVCYDAWVLEREWFKNIGDEQKWRTDILWVRNIEEVINFSILSNLISQSYFWGPLKDAWIAFVHEYKLLLEKYNISEILNWKWVHDPNIKNTNEDISEYTNHYELVKKCTDILNQNISDFNNNLNRNTLIFELRNLLWKYVRQYNLINSWTWKLNTPDNKVVANLV